MVSLPWVEDHPDVFNDLAFTHSVANTSEFSPRGCPGATASPEPLDYDSGHADSDEDDDEGKGDSPSLYFQPSVRITYSSAVLVSFCHSMSSVLSLLCSVFLLFFSG